MDKSSPSAPAPSQSDAAPGIPERRRYIRDTEENRREALIQAAQSLVAEGGMQAATVRAIAARAGVTPGLIRHYFNSKDELLRTAYVALMDGMTDTGEDALSAVGTAPDERLAAFIAATLRPPVLDPRAAGLWAGYLHQVQSDPGLLARHESSYLRFRDRLQQLIADLGRDVPPARLRSEAIACNATLDGLWLEGSILTNHFAPGELIVIGLRSVGAILGVDLMGFDTFIPEIGIHQSQEGK
ncbi:TetR family transcriptional regulator [Xinfangfangia sp. D13-10-4-6]|uniref:TetR/AcrR family transcriptional regulator n=1 Tax=Pseudogemmobacter hezensis TaxID=2737662 RepID=UPI0015531F2E|nr:TetR family transcriptional regulator C-terminal domain-containing protein [Pseudogemmobacter hezensis]NPD16426.1 TetR family transcriptional regulator [Pseudogemmobacter hezensis]